MGQSPPSSTYNSKREGLPFFQGKAEFTELHPVPVKWCDKPKKVAEVNDILISVRAPVGSLNIANQKCCIGRGLAAIRFSGNYLFLYYYLKLKEEDLDALGTGTTFRAISGKVLNELEIPFPPLPTQHRIVAKIEELLSELDRGVESLKKAKAQLKAYRQAVLNSSIIGSLIKVNEAQKTAFLNDNLVPIANCLDDLDQGWSPHCEREPSTDENEWGVIKTTAVQSLKFVPEENKLLPIKLTPRQNLELKEGDLLVTRAGPRNRVGVCCLVKKVRSKLILCDKVYRLTVNAKVVIPAYLEIALNAPRITKQIDELKTGISDSGVNLTQKGFKKLQIPIPSIEIQYQTIQEIESRFSVADHLGQSIDECLQKAEALRQSILKRAFEGKLVAEEQEMSDVLDHPNIDNQDHARYGY